MSQLKCPHCGSANPMLAAYCTRCQRPMRLPVRRDDTALTSEPPHADTVVTPPGHPWQDDVPAGAGRTSPVPKAFERLGQRRLDVPLPLPDFAPEPAHDQLTVVRTGPLPPEPSVEPKTEPEIRAGLERAVDVEATVIPTARPPWPRLIGAMLLDLGLAVGIVVAIASAEMLSFGGRWPETSGALSAFAEWAHLYPGTVGRAVAATAALCTLHSIWGARHGRTLGRRAMGLVALRSSGHAISWQVACLRALAGLASFWLFGAGFYWTVVDGQRRTLHEIAADCLTVRRRGLER